MLLGSKGLWFPHSHKQLTNPNWPALPLNERGTGVEKIIAFPISHGSRYETHIFVSSEPMYQCLFLLFFAFQLFFVTARTEIPSLWMSIKIAVGLFAFGLLYIVQQPCFASITLHNFWRATIWLCAFLIAIAGQNWAGRAFTIHLRIIRWHIHLCSTEVSHLLGQVGMALCTLPGQRSVRGKRSTEASSNLSSAILVSRRIGAFHIAHH